LSLALKDELLIVIAFLLCQIALVYAPFLSSHVSPYFT